LGQVIRYKSRLRAGRPKNLDSSPRSGKNIFTSPKRSDRL